MQARIAASKRRVGPRGNRPKSTNYLSFDIFKTRILFINQRDKQKMTVQTALQSKREAAAMSKE